MGTGRPERAFGFAGMPRSTRRCPGGPNGNLCVAGRKAGAVMASAGRPPMFAISAKLLSSKLWYSSQSGRRQACRWPGGRRRPAVRWPSHRCLASKPVAWWPRATMQGAGEGGQINNRRRVKTSSRRSGRRHSTRRRFASVLRISTVWPDIVVTMSRGAGAARSGMFQRLR